MISFPRSRILEFYKVRGQLSDSERSFYRKGQHFYNFMKLEKITNAEDKAFCEMLWRVDSLTAGRLIIARTDWNN